MNHAWRRAIIVSVAGLGATGFVGAVFALWIQSSGDWRLGLPWERALLLGIDRSVPLAFDWLMLGLPWIGTNLTLMPIICAFSLWLWRKKGRGELALHLMIVATGSLILNAVLKSLYDRPRPELWPHRGQYQWASYPSGHAIVGVSVIFTIAIMLYRERRWRWPFVVAACVLILNLYSRLYLGVHWPTDIVGGLVIGVVWLAVTEYAFRPLERRDIVRHPRGSSRLGSDPLRLA
jgi:undecaprenyl-diphosphatase